MRHREGVTGRPGVPGRGRATLPTVVAALLLCAVAVLTLASLWRLATAGAPFSPIDEHMHADTQFRVHQGEYPARGDLIGPEVIEEWTCRVGHGGVTWGAECGSPEAQAANIPTGQYTTGYIHYPTYFVLGEAYRWLHDLVAESEHPLDTYRTFAAVMTVTGLLACAVIAFGLGLRGAGLVAATLAPVATSSILSYGTMVNPMSIATLCGALVAGAGLRWVLTGRGYWWLLAATVFAACVAATSSLPAGVFLLAGLVAPVARRLGWRPDTPWRPRWWQTLLLAAALVVPIQAYGAWISSRATVPNDALYGSYGFESWTQVGIGVAYELFTMHLPWLQGTGLNDATLTVPQQVLMWITIDSPTWLTMLVGGGLLLGAVGALRTRRTPPAPEGAAEGATDRVADDAPPRTGATLQLLAVCCLLGMQVYPPALRLANALNVGIDYPIVSRYSISMLPLLVWVCLLLVAHRRWYARLLAFVATLSIVAVTVNTW